MGEKIARVEEEEKAVKTHIAHVVAQYFETIQTLIIKLKGICAFYLKSSCQINIKFGV